MVRSPFRPNAPRSRAAFTLVELLVVIGIIALLISILLPALNRARDSATTLRCLSNLRQIGSGLQLYSNATKGFLPPGYQNVASGSANNENWATLMIAGKYLVAPVLPNSVSYAEGVDAESDGSVLRCPAGAAVLGGGVDPVDHTDGRGQRAYRRGSNLLNGAIDNWYACFTAYGAGKLHSPMRQVLYTTTNGPIANGYAHCKISQIRGPATMGLFFDGYRDVQESANQGARLNARHSKNRATNVLFADGHCETVPAVLIPNAQWTLAELTMAKYAGSPRWRLDQP